MKFGKNRCFLWMKHKVRYKKGVGCKCERCGATAYEIEQEKQKEVV